jgi:hypothetical protein
MPRSSRIFTRLNLPEKGIKYSRQRLNELIKEGLFPSPDGRTTDHPNSPPWWFDRTIDSHLRDRAAKHAAATSKTARVRSPLREKI